MSRTIRDNSCSRTTFTDAWIQSQANRITQLSAKDRKTYKSVEEKQQRMITILKQQREEEHTKQKLKRIATELNDIKDHLLNTILKYEKVEKEGAELDTYETDLSTLKSIKTLFENL
jgi:hypothetical protein